MSARSRARAGELLALVRLDGHADALAGTLSGGQRKLLELVRALMAEPRILLLDEPMAGVSPALRVELLEHILALRERDGITLLIVEHDLDFVMRASDRVIVMNDGRVIAQGSPDEVRADERVVDAYLGARHEASMSLLEVDALEAGYDDALVLRGVSLDADAERDRRGDRTERRRQVDAAEGGLRPRHAPAAARCASPARTSPACAPTG